MTAYTQASEHGAQNIILNFEKLEYMNSSGIGLLITLLIRCNRQKQRLVAIHLTDHYRQIFELTRLNEAIKIYSSEADALSVSLILAGIGCRSWRGLIRSAQHRVPLACGWEHQVSRGCC